MGREPVELELDGVKLVSSPLPYEKAEDIMADVLGVISHVLRTATDLVKTFDVKSTDDIMALTPVLGAIADQLGDGRLKKLAPLVLAATVAQTPGGDFQLLDKKQRGSFFDEYPQLYFPSLFHAGRVTFGRFFSVKGLLASKKKTAEKS